MCCGHDWGLDEGQLLSKTSSMGELSRRLLGGVNCNARIHRVNVESHSFCTSPIGPAHTQTLPRNAY